jgi:hypothetical protein
MKFRLALFVLGALLIASLAAADTGAPSSVLLQGSTCAAVTSAPLLLPPPALGAPAPQALALMCGTCSGVCSGAVPNSVCLGGTKPKRCQIQDTCSTGGFSCVCTNLAPP